MCRYIRKAVGTTEVVGGSGKDHETTIQAIVQGCGPGEKDVISEVDPCALLSAKSWSCMQSLGEWACVVLQLGMPSGKENTI